MVGHLASRHVVRLWLRGTRVRLPRRAVDEDSIAHELISGIELAMTDLTGFPDDSARDFQRDEPSRAHSAIKWTMSHQRVVLPVVLGADYPSGRR